MSLEEQEQERIEKAKLEEERLNRAFSNTNKKKQISTTKPKFSTSSSFQNVSPPKKETKPIERRSSIQSNTVVDDIMEEQITESIVEQDGKKIKKKIKKKVSKKLSSTFNDSLDLDEIDWIQGDLCAGFYKLDQRFHHARISRPTEYGSFIISFLHDSKEQDTVRSGLRPLIGNEYKIIDRNAKSSGVETEESEGFAFLKSSNKNKRESVELNGGDVDKELVRLGFKVENQSTDMNRSDVVVTSHQYEVLDEEEKKENRERYEQMELERLNKKVILFDMEEENKRKEKEEEERILKEKQELQRKKGEERLRQFEESQKN
eukprot:TRINITY_DN8294_c0_g1_i1.p1 TRINITY_DN8294_c0_g1~~TRINITY_DN8294_c0_g1_i1.p1  ORF type:complete len:319 (-),score=113.98 TRINITY_DN8294_c0_g1_i1:39-995(-)